MLHITNGDSTLDKLRLTGIAGDMIAWKDVLHEGPTPQDMGLKDFSELRATYLASQGWGSRTTILKEFKQRNGQLIHFRKHEEVVLWFEHDLYDQLQLIQLLDWFSQRDFKTQLSLICIDAFPGVERFIGLGQLTPPQLASLFATRQAVSSSMLLQGRKAWRAYCMSFPLLIEHFIKNHTNELPFLTQALLRQLEQFPAEEDGLSRTERQLLAIVAEGVQQPVDIFLADQQREERPFMGDTILWLHLSRLCEGPNPLLICDNSAAFSPPDLKGNNAQFLQQKLLLSKQGRAVLDGQADWITLNGGIDRWLGGTHLEEGNVLWRWDRQKTTLVPHEDN